MKTKWILCWIMGLLMVSDAELAVWGEAPATGFAKWENEIAHMESLDRTNHPALNGNVFIGSSSFRLWTNLTADFPKHQVVNHGFGGSQLPDATHFLDRLVFPLKPAVVALYAGDNDLAAGRTPAQILADYKEFVAKVRAQLPKAKIVYVAIKPSPSRWALKDKAIEANRLIAAEAKAGTNLVFVDVYSAMLNPEGTPIPDLFVADKLHMNRKRYAIWRDLLEQHLQ